MLYFVILLIIVGIIAFFSLTRSPFTITAHWQTFLDGFQMPSSEFYAAVKAGLQERQLTRIAVVEESFLERHIMSAKRVYIRVTQDEYIIFINCAPYGTGTFVSSWLCTRDENFWNKIPILSKLMGKDRKNKTFYQMDTEAMFKLAVHSAVLAVVDGSTNAKGYRGLTELERQIIPGR